MSKYKLNHVNFYVDDHQVLAQPYKPQWDGKNYLREYMALLSVMNLDGSLVGSCMDYNLFGCDYSIFAVNLHRFESKERGIISVEVGFEIGLTKACAGLLVCVVFSIKSD